LEGLFDWYSSPFSWARFLMLSGMGVTTYFSQVIKPIEKYFHENFDQVQSRFSNFWPSPKQIENLTKSKANRKFDQVQRFLPSQVAISTTLKVPVEWLWKGWSWRQDKRSWSCFQWGKKSAHQVPPTITPLFSPVQTPLNPGILRRVLPIWSEVVKKYTTHHLPWNLVSFTMKSRIKEVTPDQFTNSPIHQFNSKHVSIPLWTCQSQWVVLVVKWGSQK